MAKRDYAGAVDSWRQASLLQPGTATVHLRLAELYDALGRTAESRRERATHVERKLEELRRRAEEGAYGF